MVANGTSDEHGIAIANILYCKWGTGESNANTGRCEI
jgi:hypothetical protein